MLRSLLLAAVLTGPAPAATSPGTAPHTVIAQGLVEMTAGDYAWSHTAHDVAAATVGIEPGGPAFLLVRGGGTVLLDGTDGSRALLAGGEAVSGTGEASTTWTAIALAESGGGVAAPAARLDAIAIVPAEPGDAAFAIAAGAHDVELRHLELAGGASAQPPGETPGFVLVMTGTVVDDAGTIVEPGGTVLLGSGSTVTNPGEQPAVVLMAIIGPVIDSISAAATSTTTAAASTDPPPPPATTSTTTTTDAPIDTDGDGLTDNEEADAGTKHNDPDSDDDTLTDGDELETYGTDPLDKDTDDDQLPDAGEVITYGSDPLDPDTDDDGLTDIEGVDYGTGPTNPDTDDDGLGDGQEVNDFGSDPHSTDTDGDSLSDGEEVNTWGSDPTDTDSDGDTLVDGEEVNGTHTNPADWDSDDDGVSDSTEAGNGTDPNDPNDP